MLTICTTSYCKKLLGIINLRDILVLKLLTFDTLILLIILKIGPAT